MPRTIAKIIKLLRYPRKTKKTSQISESRHPSLAGIKLDFINENNLVNHVKLK